MDSTKIKEEKLENTSGIIRKEESFHDATVKSESSSTSLKIFSVIGQYCEQNVKTEPSDDWSGKIVKIYETFDTCQEKTEENKIRKVWNKRKQKEHDPAKTSARKRKRQPKDQKVLRLEKETQTAVKTGKSPVPNSKKKPRKKLCFACDHCGRSFKSKYSVIWHMKQHMQTMPFNCDVCHKGFSYQRSFEQHLLSHAARIECEKCGKKLKPHAIYYHMKYRHSEERTLKCPMCEKTFKTKDNMQRHIMRHKMSFRCDECGRSFPENSRLQMHLRLHTHPEEFLCKVCGKSFEHIDRHVKRMHQKERKRNLKCRYCDYATDSKQTLVRHEEMHVKRQQQKLTVETFQCSVCKVALQTKQGVKSHMRHYHKNMTFKEEEKEEEESNKDENVFIDCSAEIKIEKEEISVIQ